jgi:hypothetical protein
LWQHIFKTANFPAGIVGCANFPLHWFFSDMLKFPAGIVGCVALRQLPYALSFLICEFFPLGLLAAPTSLQLEHTQKCKSFPLGLLAAPTSLRIELAQSSNACNEGF